MFRRPAWLLFLLIVVGSGLVLLLSPGGGVHAQVDRPVMPNIDSTSRLAPPPMSDPPTQMEWGRYNYWLSCMVCHGDRGQGLTDEWRTATDVGGENCWQARCHAASHPPEGFELPRYVPPVLGEYALLRFQTVGELQAYLQETMPWYWPGLLEEEIYWQLAIYLADANGAPNIPDNNADWAALTALPLREAGAASPSASSSTSTVASVQRDTLAGNDTTRTSQNALVRTLSQLPRSMLSILLGFGFGGLLLVFALLTRSDGSRADGSDLK